MKKAVLALMAAGQSRRFGSQDKLGVLLHGKMLGLHSAETFAPLPFAKHYVIAGRADHPCARGWQDLGYEIIINSDAAKGQSTSIALAAQTARGMNAGGLCIALADMPFVTADHINKLLRAFDEENGLQAVASGDGENAMPPVIFPDHLFDVFTQLSGDQGGRAYLKDAQKVQVKNDILMDIDTPEMLDAANKRAN